MERKVGRWELTRELGSGGMGAVWEAHDPLLPGRRLALKRLHAELSDSGGLERFLREAELLARVRHPGVVAVHAVGRDASGPYLVTDLIDGRSLEDLVRAGGLPPAAAVQLVARLCDAVEALHRAGVVHRDLKPGNVLVRPDGAPVLLDFGLSRDLDREGITRTGELVGTPAYMAPEQVLDAKRVDARADVYALGAILYALLRGRAPFQGPLFQVLEDVLERGPVWPVTAHAPLDALCRQVMARDPAARPPSAAALGEALRGLPAAAGSPGRALLALLAGSAGALALLLVGLVLLLRARPALPPPAQPVAPPPAATPDPLAPEPLVPARPPRLLGAAALERLLTDERNPAARLEGLMQLRLALASGLPEAEVLTPEAERRLMQPLVELGGEGYRQQVEFLPGTHSLLLRSPRRMYRWNLTSAPASLHSETGDPRQSWPILGAVRPAGALQALAVDGPRLLGIELRDGSRVWEVALEGAEPILGVRADPGGERVLVATVSRVWLLVPQGTGYEPRPLGETAGVPAAVTWSPDGRRVGLLTQERRNEQSGALQVYDREGRSLGRWPCAAGRPLALALTVEGEALVGTAGGRIVAVAGDGQVREVWSSRPEALRPEEVRGIVLSPDRRRIWAAIRVPDTSFARLVWLAPGPDRSPEHFQMQIDGTPTGLAVSHDGALVAVGLGDGRVWVLGVRR